MGGILTLLFMWLGCKVFSHIVNFSIPEQLAKGNMAAGLMIMGIFIGIGTAMTTCRTLRAERDAALCNADSAADGGG